MLMDVLIVEQNELLAAVLADALADEGIAAAVVPDDEEALAACQPDMPQVVVTGINRRRDDMRGLQFGRAIRNRCPLLAVIYMAALFPTQAALNKHERSLPSRWRWKRWFRPSASCCRNDVSLSGRSVRHGPSIGLRGCSR
jgi:CheY-like chemotaxis protein